MKRSALPLVRGVYGLVRLCLDATRDQQVAAVDWTYVVYKLEGRSRRKEMQGWAVKGSFQPATREEVAALGNAPAPPRIPGKVTAPANGPAPPPSAETPGRVGDVVRFSEPIKVGPPPVNGASLEQLIAGIPVFPPIEAESIPELASALGLDSSALATAVSEFNRAVRPGAFDPGILDNCRTEGIDPPKSHWARPIDSPPYYGYPLRPGITFTYLGVTIDEQARVIMQDERAAKNIFAAGEIMAGNILRKGYLGGFGLTIGAVFGRIAGREAARFACA